MGQYHILVNLTKKEFVYPHQIGNGLKLLEQVGFEYSTATALTMLIAASNGVTAGILRNILWSAHGPGTKSPLSGIMASKAISMTAMSVPN